MESSRGLARVAGHRDRELGGTSVFLFFCAVRICWGDRLMGMSEEKLPDGVPLDRHALVDDGVDHGL